LGGIGIGKDLGQVVSDRFRVKLDRKTGTVRRVMSDKRSIVDWDDKTASVVYSGRLTVLPK
jgi:hypothetical protein